MNYCSNCGARVSLRIPSGDDRPRHVCDACHMVHYQNPKLVVGCVPEWDGRVLLCRRAIRPRLGFWTLPAGFMENGETMEQAAVREAMEESNARLKIEAPFALFDIPRISQVYLMFRARLLEPGCSPGFESLEVGLFHEREIPWNDIAFPSIERTLALYFEDRRAGRFEMHVECVRRRPGEQPGSRPGVPP